MAGGDGNAASLASPLRRSVAASCALVGTPFNSVFRSSVYSRQRGHVLSTTETAYSTTGLPKSPNPRARPKPFIIEYEPKTQDSTRVGSKQDASTSLGLLRGKGAVGLRAFSRRSNVSTKSGST